MDEQAPEELLPISALQHLLFCERQCALIHIERLWTDNVLTVEGTHMHRVVHDPHTATRSGVRILRSLPLFSHGLGLRGIADVVERHPDGTWIPIEYKRGRAKRGDHDRVQVCAQAMCLEEMVDAVVPQAFLFYGKSRRRERVELSPALRRRTRDAASRLHALFASGRTPPARLEPKCRRCSLRETCMPESLGRSVRDAYLARMAAEIAEEGP